jgi:hydroxyacid-oxoacid transhydrogenase
VASEKESVFSIETAPIVFGPGASQETGFHLRRLGVRRAMLVSDPYIVEVGITERVRAAIAELGIDTEVYGKARVEPDEQSLLDVIAAAREGGYDGFVGIGGGSSVDTAKVAALFATHGGELLDYVNMPVGLGKPIPGPLLPLVAVPTTAGTGTEATAAAVMDLTRAGKNAISHRYLRPRIGIVDPLLTLDLPPMVTASCGLDVVCHAVESYTALPFTSRLRSSPDERPTYQGANPISDVWCRRAIEAGARFLRRAVADGGDEEARTEMMLASTMAGIGFGNSGVHIPHACSYPIASLRHAWTPSGYPNAYPFLPHGFSVAITAPAAFQFTEESGPERHREAANLLGGEDLAEAFAALLQDIGAPTSLAEIGYGEPDLPTLAAETLRQERLLATSPRAVTREDIEGILRASL